MRVAIYARYSTDRQSESSAEDQARLCRERAVREGWAVVAEFFDAAMSGATRDRPQLVAMIARVAEFDLVLCESLDRLSRDQEDIAAIHKRLRFAGVGIVTLADGAIGEEMVGVKGMISAVFLRDLGQKTRRGQIGVVASGRIPGGISYGYDKVHQLDRNGEPIRGLRQINEGEAAIVRRIVREYLLDISTRETVRRLNAEGVRSPGGKLWRANAITGHRGRRNGILNNELYAGRIVFNRQRFIRDPDSRRRVSRPNPPGEWVIREVPELRIVGEADWAALQAKLERGANQPYRHRRRPKRLFSGLLRCGQCGGPVTILGGEQWGCAAQRETGTCTNRCRTLNSEIERRLLGALRDDLLHPDVVSAYNAAYHAATKAALAKHAETAVALKKMIREADARVAHFVAAIGNGAALTEIKTALLAASAERDGAKAELAEIDAAHIVTMHPRLADSYRQRILDLGQALAGEGDKRAEARQILRGLIDRVLVFPKDEGRGVDLELHGRLAEIIRFAQQKKAPAEAGAECAVQVVAGARSRLCSALSVVRI